MIRKFTDGEAAVIYDALGMAREQVKAAGYDTPDIDSAQRKLGAMFTPATNGITIVTDEDAEGLAETA